MSGRSPLQSQSPSPSLVLDTPWGSVPHPTPIANFFLLPVKMPPGKLLCCLPASTMGTERGKQPTFENILCITSQIKMMDQLPATAPPSITEQVHRNCPTGFTTTTAATQEDRDLQTYSSTQIHLSQKSMHTRTHTHTPNAKGHHLSGNICRMG